MPDCVMLSALAGSCRLLHSERVFAEAVGIEPATEVVGDVQDMRAHGITRAAGVLAQHRVDNGAMLGIRVALKLVSIWANGDVADRPEGLDEFVIDMAVERRVKRPVQR